MREQREPGRLLGWTAAAFVVALAAHVAAALQYRSDPFFTTYVADALVYDGWARRIVDHGLAAEAAFHQAPLFPLALAGVYRFVEGPEGARMAALGLQCVLGSLAIALLVPLTRKVGGSQAAGVAAAAVALAYGPLIYHDLKLFPTALALATQCGGILALLLARERTNAAPAVGAGAAWGLACLARAEMLAFVPLALAALAFDGGPRRVGWHRPAAWLLGFGVVLAPVSYHNVRRGEPVLIAASGGENLWVGNQLHGDGGHTALDSRAVDIISQRIAAEHIAEESLGRQLGLAEISRFWTRRTLDEISDRPLAWLALEGRKLRRLLHPGEPTDLYPFGLERSEYLTALYAFAFSSWTVLSLAAAGIVWGRRTLPKSRPLLALLAVHLVLLLAFFVDSRLRLPLLFLCAPFGGLAIVEIVARFRRGGRARLTASLVAALALATLFIGQAATRPTVRDRLRLSAVLSREGRFESGLEVLAPLLASPAPDAVALDQAGWLEQQRGELAAARERYRQAQARGLPENRKHQTHTRLAAVLERLGEMEAASAEHDLAVASPGADAGSFYERGMFRLRAGERERAIRDLRDAVRRDPGWPAPRAALASLGES